MGLLDSLFGGGKEKGYKKLGQELERGRDSALGYYAPFQEAGNRGLGRYEEAINQYKDPMAFLNNIFSQYAESPAAKFRLREGLDTLEHEAAATGMLGSGALRKGVTDYTQDVIGNDMQQFLQNVLGIGNQYTQGEQNLANYGFNSANNMAGIQQQFSPQIGQARFGQSTANADMLQNLLATLFNTGANIYTGGASGALQPYTSRGQSALSWNSNPQNPWGGR